MNYEKIRKESRLNSVYGLKADILGSKEFVDVHIHRLGDVERKPGQAHRKTEQSPFDADRLIAAVEAVLGMSRNDFYRSGKNAKTVMAKEVLILTGRAAGASLPELSRLNGLDASTVRPPRSSNASSCMMKR